MERTDSRLASSLIHGLDLLEAFVNTADALTNADLARASGLSRPSVSRLTTTLATRGLVDYDAATRCYRLGPTALRLAYPVLARLALRRRARLPMKALADATGATVSLGVFDRYRMVVVEALPPARAGQGLTHPLHDVGSTLPLPSSAMGRAWLGSASAPLPAPGRACRAELARRGYCVAVSDGPAQTQTHSLAVPLALPLPLPLPSLLPAPTAASAAWPNDLLVLDCSIATRRGHGAREADRLGPRLLALARQLQSGPRDAPGGLWPEGVPLAVERVALSRQRREERDDRQFARTLAHGVDLMLAFSASEPDVGLRELARRLGLLPSTVSRIAHTLRTRGYLDQVVAGGRYRLGPAVVALTRPMLSGLSVRALARPHLLAISARFGAAASLGLRHQRGMIYVETAWQTDGRLLPPDIGAPMPMLLTAMGRAWLAAATVRERTRVLNQLRVADGGGWAQGLALAQRSLDAFAELGYCRSRDFRPEVEAIAVPFPRDARGQPPFVLNCGVLAARPIDRRLADAIAGALKEAVRQIVAQR